MPLTRLKRHRSSSGEADANEQIKRGRQAVTELECGTAEQPTTTSPHPAGPVHQDTLHQPLPTALEDSTAGQPPTTSPHRSPSPLAGPDQQDVVQQPLPEWQALPKDVVGVVIKAAQSSGDGGAVRLTCRAWWQATPFSEVDEIRCNLHQHALHPLPDTCPSNVQRLVLSFASTAQHIQQFCASTVEQLGTCLSRAGLQRLGQTVAADAEGPRRCLVLQLPGFAANARDIAAALSFVPYLHQNWPQLQVHAEALRLMGTTGLESWLTRAHNVVDVMLRTPWLSLQHLHLEQGWPTYLLPRALQDLPSLQSLSLELGRGLEAEADLDSHAQNPGAWGHRNSPAGSRRLSARSGFLAFLGELAGTLKQLELRVPPRQEGTAPAAVEELVLLAIQCLLLPCSSECGSMLRLVCRLDRAWCRPPCPAASRAAEVGGRSWAVSVALQAVSQDGGSSSEALDAGQYMDVRIAFDCM